jgi:hypothetical protein
MFRPDLPKSWLVILGARLMHAAAEDIAAGVPDLRPRAGRARDHRACRAHARGQPGARQDRLGHVRGGTRCHRR